MPASLALAAEDATVVEDYLAAMRAAGRATCRSTTQAARTCQAKIRCARLSPQIGKSPDSPGRFIQMNFKFEPVVRHADL